MTLGSLPNIKEFHTYSDMAQTEVLDVLFEPSPAIHTTLLQVIRTAVYSTYPDLIDACQIRLLSLAASRNTSEPNPVLLSVLSSHPRLGEKTITSAQSAAEQASLGGEEEELAALNKEYEEKFPGLRYVVFVNGRPRQVIFQDMRERINRDDYTKEVAAAIQAMCDIAKDRASKLLGEKLIG
ncbi:hypothetical protein PT974_04866 [Cladobotryum mycophilum]|uniref:Oxo-4-hydroxy-4-carboxy-5-ureidoimidazoline decarboxylase domain-containing protein n=1 Tax=Cladobotryum mycophilum TaxID=491253 RepID=A0ABR0SQE5_9HYPO